MQGVVITIRNLSNNSIIKVHANRISNPSIGLRRDSQESFKDIAIGDSRMLSSATNSDSDNSAQSSISSRNSIPKGFMILQIGKLEKGKLKKGKIGLCRRTYIAIYASKFVEEKR